MAIVQIYEIQTPAEAELMIDLGVDHVGTVVVDPQNWKSPAIRETIRIVQAAGKKSSLIPLYNRPERVLETLDFYHPDIVHFCDSLTNGKAVLSSCEQLVQLQQTVKEHFGDMAIMRSIPIAPPAQADAVPTLDLARLFEPVSDYFLTDTLLIPSAAAAGVEQPVAGFIGITGKICDWQMARRLVESSAIPVILAGGITPENAAAGYSQVQPAGLDSCTGTNATDATGQAVRFKKDPAKVRQLVTVVRKMDRDPSVR
jgi:phosphoribosylanthranilate isomerase